MRNLSRFNTYQALYKSRKHSLQKQCKVTFGFEFKPESTRRRRYQENDLMG